MKLLTKANRAALPAIGATDGKGNEAVVKVKFFTPFRDWTWYATEFDGDDLFFGLVDGTHVELGYFRLSQLASLKGVAVVERDRHFTPQTVGECRKHCTGQG